jgi:hypothetical protein
MTPDGKDEQPEGRKRQHIARSSAGPHPTPDWAAGLKQLYDAVVEEELPDNFRDLLAQLDDHDQAGDAR